MEPEDLLEWLRKAERFDIIDTILFAMISSIEKCNHNILIKYLEYTKKFESDFKKNTKHYTKWKEMVDKTLVERGLFECIK